MKQLCLMSEAQINPETQIRIFHPFLCSLGHLSFIGVENEKWSKEKERKIKNFPPQALY